MINTQFITQWLQQPHQLTSQEQIELEELLSAYPYFVPLRHLEAAASHSELQWNEPMLHKMQLFQGNWLLFYDLMKSSLQTEENHVSEIKEYNIPEIVSSEEQHIISETDTILKEMGDPLMNEVTREYDAEQGSIENKQFSEEVTTNIAATDMNETLIQPVYTENYFLHQGIAVSADIPENYEQKQKEEEEKALLVMMSYAEWLNHFKSKRQKDKEEEEDKKALKSMWQQEKLAAALDEETEEIPEAVFEMAVNSLTKEEDLASESLAEILVKQGKYDKAIEMYRKLSLRNPQKNAYFAARIEKIEKQKS